VRTLWDYLGDPERPIPHFRLKRKVLIKKSEFDCWIENFRFDANKIDARAEELLHDM
jgi:hypothetical protein